MTHIHAPTSLNAIERLIHFLNEICQAETDESFVRKLAKAATRWVNVSALLDSNEALILEQIANRSRDNGFSPGNLKAHYVLDEDFVNGGSGFVLFSLIGTTWSLVVPVKNQNRFTSLTDWQAGSKV